MPEHGVGAEHPLNDRLQNVFLLVFLVVWAADSFFLHFALNLLGLVWLLITVPLGVLTLTFGVYLAKKSMVLVFHNETGGVIDWGVYGYVRHPMYLAIASTSVARNLLIYRHNQLAGAYENARRQGLPGVAVVEVADAADDRCVVH